MSIDGILNVLKPSGKTSFAVVSLVRRWSGERRAGHTGTLDPDATGVLVVCLGQATRIVEYVAGTGKTYQAEIELGVTTDTYDAAGKEVGRSDPSSVTEELLRQVLQSFRGAIAQVPPMHSAIHHKGRRLYELAREGIEVPREARQVEISRLELLAWEPPLFTVEVDCSGGTYIRSLAHDIGEALGCGAHLRKLVRLKSGPFRIDDAVPLTVLEDAFRGGDWLSCIHPMDEVLMDWPAAIMDPEGEALVRKGTDVELHLAGGPGPAGSHCRAYTGDGHFLAVLTRTDAGLWHPGKVFRTRCCEAGETPPPCRCG